MFTVNPLQRCYEGSSSSSSRMTGSLSNYDDHCYENVTENYLFMFFQTLSLLFSLTQYLKCPKDGEFFRNVSKINTGNGKLLSSVLTSSTQHRLWKFHVVILQWKFRTKNFDTPAIVTVCLLNLPLFLGLRGNTVLGKSVYCIIVCSSI